MPAIVNQSRKQTGFSLLEILVVMVIMVLLTTVLLQGLDFVMQLRLRFNQQQQQYQRFDLQAFWFRSSSRALLADYEDTLNSYPFKGEAQQFQGLSTAALDNPAGVPTRFSWRLKQTKGKTELQYQQAPKDYWTVMRWPETEAYFSYRDKDGGWHTQWPPTLGLETPQLPVLIQLQGFYDDKPFTWIVKPVGRRDPAADYRLLDVF